MGSKAKGFAQRLDAMSEYCEGWVAAAARRMGLRSRQGGIRAAPCILPDHSDHTRLTSPMHVAPRSELHGSAPTARQASCSARASPLAGGFRAARRRHVSIAAQAQATAGPRSMRQLSSQMKDMRNRMDEVEDERLKALMAGLRGANINDSDFASSGVQMNLVEVAASDDDEQLPLTYDPEVIAAYWCGAGQRARAYPQLAQCCTRNATMLSVQQAVAAGSLWSGTE